MLPLVIKVLSTMVELPLTISMQQMSILFKLVSKWRHWSVVLSSLSLGPIPLFPKNAPLTPICLPLNHGHSPPFISCR